MKRRVLEANVDDIGFSGVYALVRKVILNQSQFKIDIACLEPFESQHHVDELAQFDCDVHYVGYSGSKWLKQVVSFFKILQLLKQYPYDVIHIHSDVSNKQLIFALAAKIRGVKKIILHAHASNVDGRARMIKYLLHLLCRRSLKYLGTDFVSCSSLASEWMFPNVEASRIVMIVNGVDIDKFQFDQAQRTLQRQQLGLRDEYVIGHVGRFAYQKNHTFILRVFKQVLNEIPQAKLLLVGSGSLEYETKNQVKQLGLEEKVIFYGVSNEIENLLQTMDIFILPSHFEGLPIVGVEAQASGLPVIFSDTITREVALTKHVHFIPITDEAISSWYDMIKAYVSYQRQDQTATIIEAGFTSEDTVNGFLNLY